MSVENRRCNTEIFKKKERKTIVQEGVSHSFRFRLLVCEGRDALLSPFPRGFKLIKIVVLVSLGSVIAMLPP